MEEKKKKDRMHAPQKGPVDEQWFHLLGKALHWQGDQLDRKGAFRAHRRAQQLFCGSQDRLRPTADAPCHGPMHLNLREVSASAHEGWVLECGVSREDPVG